MKGSKILVATDLSENAAPAALWAQQFGKKTGLPVVGVYVLDISMRSWKGAYDILEDKELREKAHTKINAWFEQYTGARPDEVILEVGSPLSKLIQVSQNEDAAMLVIGMSGKGAWNKFVFGSTALKLAHTPPCPLVVVHPEHTQIAPSMNITVGTDFSEKSDAALQFASEIARAFQAPLNVVHANIMPSTTVITEADLPEGLQRTSIVEWAEKAMERFVDEHEQSLKDVSHTSHIVTDYPVRGLMKFVQDNDVDVVVLGHAGAGESKVSKLSGVAIKAVQQMKTTTILVPHE